MAHPYCPPTPVVVPGRTTPAEHVRRRRGAPGVATVPIHEQRTAKVAAHLRGTSVSEPPSGTMLAVEPATARLP